MVGINRKADFLHNKRAFTGNSISLALFDNKNGLSQLNYTTNPKQTRNLVHGANRVGSYIVGQDNCPNNVISVQKRGEDFRIFRRTGNRQVTRVESREGNKRVIEDGVCKALKSHVFVVVVFVNCIFRLTVVGLFASVIKKIIRNLRKKVPLITTGSVEGLLDINLVVHKNFLI